MRLSLGIAALAAASLALLMGLAAANEFEAPEQPIAFSHAQHAGEVGLACEYCHSYVRRGPVAGMPTVRRCMGCHEIVGYDLPEIEKLTGYMEREEPILWNKVYDLEDHTRFFHDRHVKAQVECSTCHGPVETMERVRQYEELSMGWCIECHRDSGASLECLDCHH